MTSPYRAITAAGARRRTGLLALVALLAPAVALGGGWKLAGFDTPESVLADPDTGDYYVSNINGKPDAKDGNGYIAVVGPGGKLKTKGFAKGLDAPKGMAIAGENLYVADIDRVVGIDRRSGRRVAAATVDLAPLGAKFLNDMVADEDGVLYVSDTHANIIFSIEPASGHRPRVLYKSDDLAGPNGLAVKKSELYVVSWGGSGSKSAGVGVLKADSGSPRGVALVPYVRDARFSNLDGAAFDGKGRLWVSDFTAGKIYRISPGGGRVDVRWEGLTTPADLSLDLKRNLVLIPSFQGNTVEAR